MQAREGTSYCLTEFLLCISYISSMDISYHIKLNSYHRIKYFLITLKSLPCLCLCI